MMHKLLVFIILLLLSVPHFSFAAAIKAEGYGSTEAEARANATAELSFIIYSDVKSVLHTDTSNEPGKEKNIVSKQIDITSAVPVYGAAYTVEEIQSGFHATAVMIPEKAVPIYRAELEQAVKQINKVNSLIKGERSSSDRYFLVMSGLSQFENLEKIKAVLNVFGADVKKYPDITVEELQRLKKELTERSDSMSHTAEMIAREFKQKRVYVYYPMYNGSDEVTQFSSVFRDMLLKEFSSVDSVFDADYFLETIYTDAEGGLYLTASMTDKNGVTAGKSVKLLEENAYKGLKVKPSSLSFEKLLKLGLAQSADFNVRISTSNGKKAMLYHAGESVELFVKLNRPGYFFMVGHIDKNGERYSYLVDFYNTPGNRKFVRRVGADELNRWMSLGEFDIVPPYGLETFQIIATIKDPVDMIPAHVFDTETELYIVSRNISEGVTKSRAIRQRPENIDASAEDILIFSTTDK